MQTNSKYTETTHGMHIKDVNIQFVWCDVQTFENLKKQSISNCYQMETKVSLFDKLEYIVGQRKLILSLNIWKNIRF